VKAFAITYELQCAARRFRSRDVVFSTTANTEAPESGVIDEWSGAAPGSVAALVLDAACFGRMDSEARQIAGAPRAEAERIFAERRVVADAAPTPRAGSGGLLPRDQVAACLRQRSAPRPRGDARPRREGRNPERAAARWREPRPIRRFSTGLSGRILRIGRSTAMAETWRL
jgi:hypothetical protein